jgi:hypothetical protein
LPRHSPNSASRLEYALGSPGVSPILTTDSCVPSGSVPGWCDSPDEAALVPTSQAEAAPDDLPSAPSHSYGIRLKHNICQPKVRTDGTVTYSVVRAPAIEPTAHIAAMKNPFWCQAMIDEYQALLQNNT